ncbi:MAG: DUF4388 domain-containing protein [Candidatus Nanopelagicales bacterium]
MTVTLTGSLTEFSISDVLNLLAMGGRTAVVKLTGPDSTGAVWLDEGSVCAATADDSRASLLRAVVAALDVPAVDLQRVLDAPRPAQALVDMGVVDAQAARSVAGEHCLDAMGQLLEWGTGQFEVHAGAGDPEDLGVRVAVDTCLAKALDRAARWSELRAALPEPVCVLALTPVLSSPPVLDLEDWAVLARIDGHRPVAAVLAALGAAPLAAGDRLVELIRRGLVAPRSTDGAEQRAAADELLAAFDAVMSPARSGVRSATIPSAEQVNLVVGEEPGVVPTAEPVRAPAGELAAGDASDEVGVAADSFAGESGGDGGWSESEEQVARGPLEMASAAGREAFGEQWGSTSASVDEARTEAAGWDAGPSEAAGWEAGPGQAAGWTAGPGEAAGWQAGPGEAGGWEAGRSEAAGWEAAGWEAAGWDAAEWSGEVQRAPMPPIEVAAPEAEAHSSWVAAHPLPTRSQFGAPLGFDQGPGSSAPVPGSTHPQGLDEPQPTDATAMDPANEWTAAAPAATSDWGGPRFAPAAVGAAAGGAAAVGAADSASAPDGYPMAGASLGVVDWDPEAWEGEPPVAWQGETWDNEPVGAEPVRMDSATTDWAPDGVAADWVAADWVAADRVAADGAAAHPAAGHPLHAEPVAGRPVAADWATSGQTGAAHPLYAQPVGADEAASWGGPEAFGPLAAAGTQDGQHAQPARDSQPEQAVTWSPWAEALGLGIPEQGGPAHADALDGAEFAHNVAHHRAAAHDAALPAPEQMVADSLTADALAADALAADPLAADPLAADPLATGLLAQLMSSARGQ